MNMTVECRCGDCGASVTATFTRGFATNDDRVHGYPACFQTGFLEVGVAADPERRP